MSDRSGTYGWYCNGKARIAHLRRWTSCAGFCGTHMKIGSWISDEDLTKVLFCPRCVAVGIIRGVLTVTIDE